MIRISMSLMVPVVAVCGTAIPVRDYFVRNQ